MWTRLWTDAGQFAASFYINRGDKHITEKKRIRQRLYSLLLPDVFIQHQHEKRKRTARKLFMRTINQTLIPTNIVCLSQSNVSNCPVYYYNNNNLILILRNFHEMIKRALHDFYL